MARILVTGGAGFLGSHLCDRLLDDGHDVLCVDNFFTGSKRNIAHRLNHPYFELMRHDVTFPLFVEVDQIYNLACPASPVHYQHDPVQTTKTSVHGAINMLGLAKRLRARIFQASTSEVYGDPEVHPQPEGYWGRVNPIGIRSCYDEGKRCAETLFFDYHRQHALDIKVVRIFNTYGPRMHPNDGRVVSNFIVQALRGEDITIYGDGSQSRSFCYVDDLIEAFVRMMDTPRGFTGPVNVGNPVEFTMLELAELVLSQVGGPSKLRHLPLPEDDPRQRQPDIALAMRTMYAERALDLPDELARTWRLSADNCLVFGASIHGARKYFLPTGSVGYRIHGSNGWWSKRGPTTNFLNRYHSRLLINHYARSSGIADNCLSLAKLEYKTKPAPGWRETRRYIGICLRSGDPWWKRLESALSVLAGRKRAR